MSGIVFAKNYNKSFELDEIEAFVCNMWPVQNNFVDSYEVLQMISQ